MKLSLLTTLLLALSTTNALLPADPTDQTESILIQAADISSQYRVTRGLTKRAVSSDFRRFTSFDAYLQCQNVVAEAQCSSGQQQEVYSIAKSCGQDLLADVAQYGCGTNSDGIYCGLGLEIANSITDVQSCFSSTTSCSSTCRFRINSLKNELGCCAGHLTETFRTDTHILSGNLWSRCGVSTGSLCEVPTFSSNITESMCSLAEASRQITALRCSPSSFAPILDSLLNADGCRSLAQVQVETCGVADDGEFCSLKNDVSSFRGVAINCATSLSSSSCSSSCSSSLRSFLNEFGCCINSIFNGTLAAVYPSSTFSQIAPYFSNSLWTRCNVPPPGMCDSALALPTRPPVPPTTTNRPSTTNSPSTTNPQSTTNPPSTTNSPSTTNRQPDTNGCLKNGGIFSVIVMMALAIVFL